MAGPGDGSLRSQPSVSHHDSVRRKSELTQPDQTAAAARSKSGSFAASNAPSLERRQLASNNNGGTSPYERDTFERGLSARSLTVSNHTKPALRSIPAWVQRGDDSEGGNAFSPTLPSQPDDARVASHHYGPQSEKDRPPTDDRPTSGYNEQDLSESRWKAFTRSTAYPRSALLDNNVVSYDWLNQNMGDYSEPWQGKRETSDLESGKKSLDFKQRRKIWRQRFKFKVLHSPMVPLLIRLTVFIFCLIALALGGSIRHYSTVFARPQGASTDMAIIVDAIALAYLVYITYDEYMGKPLGLRPATAKMRLIFLDLIFIVFASANLSLAFDSLSNVTGSCVFAQINNSLDQRNDKICVRQQALASVLLIVLIAWLMTFAISVLRVVERVSA